MSIFAKDERGEVIEILDADFPSTGDGGYASSEPDMVLTHSGWRTAAGLTWIKEARILAALQVKEGRE